MDDDWVGAQLFILLQIVSIVLQLSNLISIAICYITMSSTILLCQYTLLYEEEVALAKMLLISSPPPCDQQAKVKEELFFSPFHVQSPTYALIFLLFSILCVSSEIIAIVSLSARGQYTTRAYRIVGVQ